ncbi:MAG: UMP kinase [Rhizobiaceae bacterium]|jgi:uridylate kinase|nr:UMP kinase [Rhizobiaceae bacterium]
MGSELKYKRVLLKVSGEALMGAGGFGIDPLTVSSICEDIKEGISLGAEVGIVVGGGNIFRGVALAAGGADRVSGDHMGMLATVMNAIAFRMALQNMGIDSVVLSAIDMPEICEPFSQRAAERYRDAGKVVLFAGGTGNPYFTTDTAAALRACEMRCDALMKATQVDGIYSADPNKDPEAVRFDTITHSEVLARGLEVMDAAAVSLAREASIPVVVFELADKGGFAKILKGEGRSTTVSGN